MRFLVIGFGSMGKRHYRNIRLINPLADIIVYDPMIDINGLRSCVDAAIISSPSETHPFYMNWCLNNNPPIPFLVEKPLNTTMIDTCGLPCSIGFNYRFHKQWPIIEYLSRNGRLYFKSHENLLKKYGATVGGTAASHAIDMSLKLLGPHIKGGVHLSSDGVKLSGVIYHTRGESYYDYNIDVKDKIATIGNGESIIHLERDENCYMEEMEAWIQWVTFGQKNILLATIEDGINVENCLGDVLYA